MKIFLVFQKDEESYESLPKDAEIITLFRRIRGNPNIPHMLDRCKAVLDTADPKTDFIIYNGPSYLCAIAGYVWLTQDNRTHVNFYSFNKETKQYCRHAELLDAPTDSIDPDKDDVA